MTVITIFEVPNDAVWPRAECLIEFMRDGQREELREKQRLGFPANEDSLKARN